MTTAIAILSAYRQLNQPERTFVDNYVAQLERAAHKAGERISNALYRPIPTEIVEASRGLLERPMVLAAITERINEIAIASELSVERLIRELTAIATSSLANYMSINKWGIPEYDFSKCSPEEMAALKTWEHTEDIKKGRQIKIQTHDKLGAMKLLFQLMGLGEDHPWTQQHMKRPDAPRLPAGTETPEAADVYQRYLNRSAA